MDSFLTSPDQFGASVENATTNPPLSTTLPTPSEMLIVASTEPKKRGRKRKVQSEEDVKKQPRKKRGLFIKNMFGDANNPEESDISCNTITNHTLSRKSEYFVHGLCTLMGKEKWPLSSNIACLQDCHHFGGVPVLIPHDYKPETGEYAVFGNFCSFSCAKEYVLEQGYANQREQLALLAKLEREVFDIAIPERPAPPRTMLTLFGGNLTVEDYRASGNQTYHIVHQPPCVTHMMMIEAQPLCEDVIDTDQNSQADSKRRSEKFTQQIFSLRGITAPKNSAEQNRLHQKNNPHVVGDKDADVENNKTPYEEYCEKKLASKQQAATNSTLTSTISPNPTLNLDGKSKATKVAQDEPPKQVPTQFAKFLRNKKPA